MNTKYRFEFEQETHNAINSMYDSVVAFMQACNQEVNTTQKTLSEIDRETLQLRTSLIKEEFGELISSETRTEELDALLDLMYVSLGTLASFGYKPLYLNQSLSLDDKKLSEIYIYSNYKYLDIIYNNLITYMNNDTKLSINEKKSSKELFYVLNKFILEIYDLGNRLFPQFNEAFEEVHRSNMSKLENGKALKNEYGKVIKSKSYSPPNLTQFS